MHNWKCDLVDSRALGSGAHNAKMHNTAMVALCSRRHHGFGGAALGWLAVQLFHLQLGQYWLILCCFCRRCLDLAEMHFFRCISIRKHRKFIAVFLLTRCRRCCVLTVLPGARGIFSPDKSNGGSCECHHDHDDCVFFSIKDNP